MKKNIIILLGFISLICHSCFEDQLTEIEFEDLAEETIYEFLMQEENSKQFSHSLSILQASGLDKTLSAYNPNGDGYTLFLPTNMAVEEYIDQSLQFNSLEDIISEKEFCRALFKFHILNMSIETNEFPYGAFPEPALTGDYLTVNAVIETDTSYYKINNIAPVVDQNLEFSNGYIHVVSKVLSPVTETTYEYLESTPGFSIFKAAIDLTGLRDRFDVNTRLEEEAAMNITTLVEHDSVYNAAGIYSVDDLIELISPENSDYTDPINPLYNFVAYHAVTGSFYLAELQEANSNYSTVAEIPMRINGLGIDIKINPGTEVFDTIWIGNGFEVVNYLTIYYDESNVITLSGAVHFIDNILKPFRPSRSDITFEFRDDPILREYSKEPGSYIIEDTASLSRMTWWNTELTYVKSGDSQEQAWSDDYFVVDQDFIIKYRMPAIVQGEYEMFINVNSNANENAVIEVYVDGERIGGIFDLARGGSSQNPYVKLKVGNLNFERFVEHDVEIRALIPGRFVWDYLSFEPI